MKHLADCHVHLGYGNFRKEQRSDKYQGTDLDHAYNNLLQYKDAGVTFLRDGGDRNLKAFRLREDAAKLGITLKSPGRALVRQGCYGKKSRGSCRHHRRSQKGVGVPFSIGSGSF